MKGRWWWENLGWLKAVSGFGLPMSEAVGWSGGWGRGEAEMWLPLA